MTVDEAIANLTGEWPAAAPPEHVNCRSVRLPVRVDRVSRFQWQLIYAVVLVAIEILIVLCGDR